MATRILAASARNRPREFWRSCCANWEWREVIVCPNSCKVRRKSSAVLALLTKINVGLDL